MAVTQKQIAQRLGLSQPLVAQALNGHVGVAEKTRQRVLATAQELGYSSHDNPAARTLIAQRHGTRVKTGSIAILMGQPVHGSFLQDMPFFQEILEGIHSEAAKGNLDVAIHILRPGNLPRVLTSGGVDGAICIYSHTTDEDIDAQGIKLPVVHLDSYRPHHWAIYPDNEGAIYQLTRHLLELGHERIAFLGGSLVNISKAQVLRFQGFEAAMNEAQMPMHPELIYRELVGYLEEAGYDGMIQLLNRTRDFTALVCSNDAIAIGAMSAASEQGVRVPEDLSITGFDGVTIKGYGSNSTLTTAFFDRRVMGHRAVEMLNEMTSVTDAPPRHEMLPIEILRRLSTAPPATIPV